VRGGGHGTHKVRDSDSGLLEAIFLLFQLSPYDLAANGDQLKQVFITSLLLPKGSLNV